MLEGSRNNRLGLEQLSVGKQHTTVKHWLQNVWLCRYLFCHDFCEALLLG